jgi:hypothetical protein
VLGATARRQADLLPRPELQLRRVVPDAPDPGPGAGGPAERELVPELVRVQAHLGVDVVQDLLLRHHHHLPALAVALAVARRPRTGSPCRSLGNQSMRVVLTQIR